MQRANGTEDSKEATADLWSCLMQRLFSATLPGTLTPLASLDSWFCLLIPVRPLTLPGCSSPVTPPREWAGTAGWPISFVPLSHKSVLCCCCPLSENLFDVFFCLFLGFWCFIPPITMVQRWKLLSLVLNNSVLGPSLWAPRESGNKASISGSLALGTAALLHSAHKAVAGRQGKVRMSKVRTFWPATKCCCKNNPRMTPLGNEHSVLSHYHNSWDRVCSSSLSCWEAEFGLAFPLPPGSTSATIWPACASQPTTVPSRNSTAG